MADRNIAAKLRTKIKNLEEQNHSLNSIFDSLQPGTVHATALELRAEVERLQGIIAQHELCHDLHGKVGALDFAKGCEAEQRRIYGRAPHADLIADFCEKEKEIRDLVRPILGEHATDGDSYYVPTIVDLVEMLVQKIRK